MVIAKKCLKFFFFILGACVMEGMEQNNKREPLIYPDRVVVNCVGSKYYAIVGKSDNNTQQSKMVVYSNTDLGLTPYKEFSINASIEEVTCIAPFDEDSFVIGSQSFINSDSNKHNIHVIDVSTSQISPIRALNAGKENVTIGNLVCIEFCDPAKEPEKCILAHKKESRDIALLNKKGDPLYTYTIGGNGLASNVFVKQVLSKLVGTKTYLIAALSNNNVYVYEVSKSTGFMSSGWNFFRLFDKNKSVSSWDSKKCAYLAWIAQDKLYVNNASNLQSGVWDFEKKEFFSESGQMPLAYYCFSSGIGQNSIIQKMLIEAHSNQIDIVDVASKKRVRPIMIPEQHKVKGSLSRPQFLICRNRICIITPTGVLEASIDDQLFAFKSFQDMGYVSMPTESMTIRAVNGNDDCVWIKYSCDKKYYFVKYSPEKYVPLPLKSSSDDSNADSSIQALQTELACKDKAISDLQQKIKAEEKKYQDLEQEAQSLQLQLQKKHEDEKKKYEALQQEMNGVNFRVSEIIDSLKTDNTKKEQLIQQNTVALQKHQETIQTLTEQLQEKKYKSIKQPKPRTWVAWFKNEMPKYLGASVVGSAMTYLFCKSYESALQENISSHISAFVSAAKAFFLRQPA